MRPVRFVALSEDGQALVLADEVGRLLTLPIDDRVSTLFRPDRATTRDSLASEDPPSLAPRDIQARIRSGESAEDVARVLGVPVDRVLRYAGPVLQERAMLAQHARRTRLKTSDTGDSLADVVDSRLSQHGVDIEKISGDAYRRDDGTWRVVATWPSGKTNATAVWELDKARQLIAPQDDMAHYLCGAPTGQEAHRGHEVATPRPDAGRGGHEPIYPGVREPARSGRDVVRSGREALMASLERPLGTSHGRGLEPLGAPAASVASAAATGEVPRRRQGARAFYEDDRETGSHEVPAVPSLAVLRPRRVAPDATSSGDRPVKRGPNWDDILFGSAPAAKDA